MRSGIEKLKVEDDLTHEEILKKGRDSVSDGLAYLTSTQVKNFYARVLSGVDRMPVIGLGTMGVTANRGKYMLVYDPVFAARVSYEELCATLEHEVYHIILEHIPRYLNLVALCTDEDKYLHKIVANLAMDAVANELLSETWPKMRDKDQPLGYWVLPSNFTPPLPPKLAFENYQKLLFETLKQRMKSDPKDLYQMASAMMKDAMDKAQKAMQQLQQKQKQSQKQEGEESDSGQQGQQDSPGEEQQGQQSQQGQSGDQPGQQGQPGQPGGSKQAGSSGEPNPYSQMSPEELQSKVDQLDEIDKEVLKMLLSSMQSHAMLDSTNSQDGEAHQLTEHGRELIKAAAQAQKKSRGTLPGHLEELIKHMLLPPTVPWTQFLHNLVQRTRQTKKERGMARPSKIISAMRKYAQIETAKAEGKETPLLRRLQKFKRVPPFPGIKQNNKYTIVYAVDTSGSMSHKELAVGLSELQHVQKSDSDVSICVLYADTAVCKEFWIGPNDTIDASLTGRGGTDFDAVFEHVQKLMGSSEKAPDLLVYCTDGYAPPPTVRIPIPTVWLLTPDGAPVMREAGHITLQMRDYQLGEGY